jgi:ribosomal protein S18 acetylase RimI-like enzyme
LVEIVRLDAAAATGHLDALRGLLTDAVDDGAAVTFLAPLPPQQAVQFWRGRIEAITAGTCVLLGAFDGATLVGSVQINLDTPANQRHRAEINKLLVLRAYRRRGIARALMEVAHREALKEQRTLLTLDTRKNDAAEPLYRSLGYVEIGAVPRYSLNSGGGLDDALFFYKELS